LPFSRLRLDSTAQASCAGNQQCALKRARKLQDARSQGTAGRADVIDRVSTHPMSRIDELTPPRWKELRQSRRAQAA